MKQKDVQVGGIYLTRIGGELAKVVVVRQVESTGFLSSKRMTKFHVRRFDERSELPKARTASALRPLPMPSTEPDRPCSQCFTPSYDRGDGRCERHARIIVRPDDRAQLTLAIAVASDTAAEQAKDE